MIFRPVHLLTVLAVAAPLALAQPALAQDASPPAPPPATLTVTGQAEVSAAPDMALVRLGVRNEAADAAGALRANSATQGAVVEALKAAGIEARDLQTSELRLEQRMAYPDNEAPRIEGYTASNMLTVRVRDLDMLGDVLDQAIEAGATNLADLQFLREDDAELRDQARAAAVADALRRARVYAEAAGVELGEIRSIAEAGGQQPGPRPMAMMARAAAESVPVEAGELSLSARVHLELTLKQ